MISITNVIDKFDGDRFWGLFEHFGERRASHHNEISWKPFN